MKRKFNDSIEDVKKDRKENKDLTPEDMIKKKASVLTIAIIATTILIYTTIVVLISVAPEILYKILLYLAVAMLLASAAIGAITIIKKSYHLLNKFIYEYMKKENT